MRRRQIQRISQPSVREVDARFKYKKKAKPAEKRIRACDVNQPPPEPYPLRISNVVCTATTQCELPLREIQIVTQGRLDAAVFPSSVSRSKHPATTNSVFDTGKLLVTGAPSINHALLAAMLFLEKVNEVLRMDLRILLFRVQNIVSSFSLGYRLDIERFHRENKTTRLGRAQYEPTLFRGCSWRLYASTVVFVLFSSGRVVLTGASTWEDAHSSYLEWLAFFAKYKVHKQYEAQYKRIKA